MRVLDANVVIGFLDAANASILQMGVVEAQPVATPLDVATLRAKTGLPIPDCPVILSAGEPSTGTAILTFDERLATEARALGYDVLP